jgi:hypothetical protein
MSWTKTSKGSVSFTKANKGTASFTSTSTLAPSWSSTPNYTVVQNSLEEYFDLWDGYFNLNEQHFGYSALNYQTKSSPSWSKS